MADRTVETNGRKARIGVRIRVSDTGATSRRKRRLTAAERAAAGIAQPTPKPIVAPVDASIDRLDRATIRADEEKASRAAYLKELADRRVAASGATGKRAEQTQAAVYKLLGLDLKAGFEGRPPAFEVIERHKIGSKELLAGVRNKARDPIHILRTMGFVSERHHKALTAMVDLFEQHAAVGVRGIEYGERVDGGRFPDVSAHAMEVAREMTAFNASLSEHDRGLLKSVAIDGMTISDVARGGAYGKNRSRIHNKLLAALDRLARFFGIK